MVFGNRGETSGSGVAFTRDPSSGAGEPFGDVLFNAQGEDVVAGERDAEPLSAMAVRLPDVYRQLEQALATIEADARDMCEVEFTVDDGALWVLQTRVGLRGGRAAVRIAVALVAEGRISAEEAIGRMTPAQLEAAAAPGFAAEPRPEEIIARGLAASPGAATGKAVFDPGRASELAAAGDAVVLLRATTSPSDVAGFIAARGVVTGRGGRTSHAAVVARGMYRPAVCGIGEIRISDDRRRAELDGITLLEGDIVSVDGDRGLLSTGGQALDAPANDAAVRQMISWCVERARVPAFAAGDLRGLRVIDTLAGLEDAEAPVVLELLSPDAIPAAELVKALAANTAAAPVLRMAAGWLRAADVPLRGRVHGVVVPDGSPAGALLQAAMEPA
jgi:pyruvate,orthophosphate dikinase